MILSVRIVAVSRSDIWSPEVSPKFYSSWLRTAINSVKFGKGDYSDGLLILLPDQNNE